MIPKRLKEIAEDDLLALVLAKKPRLAAGLGRTGMSDPHGSS